MHQNPTHGLHPLSTRHALQTLLLLVHGAGHPQAPGTNLLGRLSSLSPRRDLLRPHPMVPRHRPRPPPTNNDLHPILPTHVLDTNPIPSRDPPPHPSLRSNHLGPGNAILSLPPRSLRSNHPSQYLQNGRLPLRKPSLIPTSLFPFIIIQSHIYIYPPYPIHPPQKPQTNRNIPNQSTRSHPPNRPPLQMPHLAHLHRRRRINPSRSTPAYPPHPLGTFLRRY